MAIAFIDRQFIHQYKIFTILSPQFSVPLKVIFALDYNDIVMEMTFGVGIALDNIHSGYV